MSVAPPYNTTPQTNPQQVSHDPQSASSSYAMSAAAIHPDPSSVITASSGSPHSEYPHHPQHHQQQAATMGMYGTQMQPLSFPPTFPHTYDHPQQQASAVASAATGA